MDLEPRDTPSTPTGLRCLQCAPEVRSRSVSEAQLLTEDEFNRLLPALVDGDVGNIKIGSIMGIRMGFSLPLSSGRSPVALGKITAPSSNELSCSESARSAGVQSYSMHAAKPAASANTVIGRSRECNSMSVRRSVLIGRRAFPGPVGKQCQYIELKNHGESLAPRDRRNSTGVVAQVYVTNPNVPVAATAAPSAAPARSDTVHTRQPSHLRLADSAFGIPPRRDSGASQSRDLSTRCCAPSESPIATSCGGA